MANIKRIIDEYLQEQMIPVPFDWLGGSFGNDDNVGSNQGNNDWSGGQNSNGRLKPIVSVDWTGIEDPSDMTNLPDWVGDLPRVDPGNGPMIYNGKLIIGGQRGFPEWGQLKPLPPKP